MESRLTDCPTNPEPVPICPCSNMLVCQSSHQEVICLGNAYEIR